MAKILDSDVVVPLESVLDTDALSFHCVQGILFLLLNFTVLHHVTHAGNTPLPWFW